MVPISRVYRGGGGGARRLFAGNSGPRGGLNIYFQGRNSHQAFQNSREEDPPRKPPTQIKTVCTNSLRKLFCLFLLILKGKRGTVCTNCPEIVCANCFYLGRWFFGWVFPS